VQLALINLNSSSNVVDAFVFADCRRSITSGLTQVASFMLTTRNIVIVMCWRLLSSCISVAAAGIYLYLNKLLCISCIRHSDRVDCFECVQKNKANFPTKHCTWITLWPIFAKYFHYISLWMENLFLIQKLYVNLVALHYFRNLSNIDDRVRNISWQTLTPTLTIYIHIHIHGHLGLTGCRNSVSLFAAAMWSFEN